VRFSQLLLEGLDHYRKGKMMEAVRAWEEAYLLEPTNLRAREFLRSALERIHAHTAAQGPPQAPRAADGATGPQQAAARGEHPWLPNKPETPTLPARPSAMPARPPTPPVDPWDDGPSLAIPQQETQSSFPGDEGSGAWSIHKDPLPIEAVADDEIQVWCEGARELVALNDFSGALELVTKILARKPADKEALQMHEVCEHNLTQMFESKIGSMEARPKVAIPPDEIIWLNLDPRAGFVLAQIDGEVSFEDLYAICGLKRLDTARILSQLLEEGVVAVQGEPRAVAKRALHPR
jgi:hypothetical protein